MREWRLASWWGSLRDGDPDDKEAAFHAGRLNDALRLNLPPQNPLLVASDTSGVWVVDEMGGPALPLSTTWASPHVNCLALGEYAPNHVYAAGDALYETDTTQPAPLLAWRLITLTDADRHRVSVGEIHRAIVVRQRRALVLATDTGVWWARIPPTPGGPYVATHVTLLPGIRYSSVAEGPDTRILAACWGSDLGNAFGIFVGDWSGPGGGLQVTTRASIFGSIHERQMLRTELAACATDRSQLYAVCGGAGVTAKLDQNGKTIPDGLGGIQWDGDDFILAVLRSIDGGMTWHTTGDHVNGETLPLFPGGPGKDLAGHTQFGYNLCVGVSPFQPDIVAVGVGGAFLSTDGGKHWDSYSPGTSAHRHTDTHGCVFDAIDPTTLYLCSDGGLATTPDLGKMWRTAANRQLPNFQFRRFAVGGHDDGLLAGSLQDNGDVFTPLYPDADPWRTLPEDGGDGILSLFTSTGHLIHHNNTETDDDASGVSVEFGAKPRACIWDAAQRQFANVQMFPNFPLSLGVIPVDGTTDGLMSNVNTGYANVIEAVTTTGGTNLAGEFMQAVAAEGEAVYGLYPKTDGTFHWQPLDTVPHKPNFGPGPTPGSTVELPYFATASASLDGHSVLVGMNNGEIFRLDEPTWAATDLSDAAITAQITRIVPVTADSIFVIAGPNAFRWNGTAWSTLPSGTPTTLPVGTTFEAFAADESAVPPRLFAATTLGLWTSEDNGTTWHPDMIGLPTVPMARDLRTVTESSGAAFVYLSTYGWSVFRRLINFPEFIQTLTIAGHMDIVDRVAFGSDLWAHPTITRLAALGPLHPKAEWTITEDDGDEVRVVLALRCAWNADRSIRVDYHAELISKDEDNDVSDNADGTHIVTFGGTGTVVIDMDSDEWWPDRAHIEFTITNT